MPTSQPKRSARVICAAFEFGSSASNSRVCRREKDCLPTNSHRKQIPRVSLHESSFLGAGDGGFRFVFQRNEGSKKSKAAKQGLVGMLTIIFLAKSTCGLPSSSFAQFKIGILGEIIYRLTGTHSRTGGSSPRADFCSGRGLNAPWPFLSGCGQGQHGGQNQLFLVILQQPVS